MKSLFALSLLFIITSCSFDNRSGIWQDSQSINKKEKESLKEFKNINLSNRVFFNKTVAINKNYKFFLDKPKKNLEWSDFFYQNNNIPINFSYENLNEIKFISKRISRFKINQNILFVKNILILSDSNGNIITYSLAENKILNKFNFYKKKIKKLKKKLYYKAENNILYVSDNIGYLYAYDIFKQKIIWAKNFKIPFRSNIKIYKNTLIASDQDNNLYFINKFNGNIIKKIPSEESLVKGDFVNNLSVNKSVFFLNTFGTLYAFDPERIELLWILNINPNIDDNYKNLFTSFEIKSLNDNLIILHNNILEVINSKTGNLRFRLPIKSNISPIVINNYIFIITDDNLLVTIELNSGKIINSFYINEQIKNFNNEKISKQYVTEMKILNSKINIFLNNNYLAIFSLEGNLLEFKKIKKKINSKIISINHNLIYVNNNKIVILN